MNEINTYYKFSVIIPTYNDEKNLLRCINSVYNNQFQDFEVIVVNDGSTDSTSQLICGIDKDNFKYLSQTNLGLSEARNNGIALAKGEYLILLDSDDTIEANLLNELAESTLTKPDLIRFQVRDKLNDKSVNYAEKGFEGLSGIEAFEKMINYHYFDMACCYCYRTKYFKENNYTFKQGKYHEDFGLIPRVIAHAKIINSIEYIGYNYYQNPNSIMHKKDYDIIKKQVYDTLDQYKDLINYDYGPVYKSYLSNVVVNKMNNLDNDDLKEYAKQLDQLRVVDYLLDNSITRKIKKALIKRKITRMKK